MDNYTDLGMEILSNALDEICPKYQLPDREISQLEQFAIKEVQKLLAFLHRGHALLIQEKFDQKWIDLEQSFNTKLENLRKNKERLVQKVLKTDNSLLIDYKLQKAMEDWDQRKQKLERRIKRRRKTFRTKVSSQVNVTFTPEEVADLRLGLDRSINREIREFENKRETSLRKIREQNNSLRVSEKAVEKEVLYDLRIRNLFKTFQNQQDTYNNKWKEEDLQGAAIHWFTCDIDKVNFWCTLTNVPLIVCYKGVKERLEMMNFDTSAIDTILNQINSGKLSSDTLPAYPFPLKHKLTLCPK